MAKSLSSDQFISLLYRKAASIPMEKYPHWAFDLLQQVIAFDGAIWATGNASTQQFHTQTTVDVPAEIFERLTAYTDINPIVSTFANRQNQAIDMADVYSDQDFYQSTLYQECFKPFGIERILSSIHLDERSGIFTLLTLYRYDRESQFTEIEKETQNRLLYHLISAMSYRQFLALNESVIEEDAQTSTSPISFSAICDSSGIYHAVESGFLDLIEPYIVQEKSQQFPATLKPHANEFELGDLLIKQEQLGQLYRLSIRHKSEIDQLTAREQQVVHGICQGSTFKQIAKQLELSPSTVSNHLYRIYDKLNINSRSELVAIAQQRN